jgi:Undecaprenyl-phosphate galactose phosphotransferase WbaP
VNLQPSHLPNAFRRILTGATLVLSDTLSLLLAGTIAVGIRTILGRMLVPYSLPILREYRFSGTVESQYAIPLILLIILVFAMRGLYDPINRGPVSELQSITIVTSMIFLFVVSLSFILRTTELLSRFVIVLCWILALGIIPLGRSVARSVFSKTNWWGELVAVVNVGSPKADFVQHLIRHPKVGARPAALIDLDSPAVNDYGKMQEILQDLRASGAYPRRIGCAMFVFEGSPLVTLNILGEFQDLFSRIILIGIAPEQRLNWSGAIDLAGVPGLEVRHNLLDRRAQIIKRAMDIILSALALVTVLPFGLLIAILIKIDSRGPVFFRQVRVGIRGDLFGMWKFRTMHTEAEQMLDRLLEADPSTRAEWDEYQKLKDDPRITRFGRFLRRFSLDEIPQFWNVLMGEMSIVGPRPYFPNQREAYGTSRSFYTRVRPGVTGLWQVSERNQATFADRAMIDAEYVRNWSIWFDLYILAKTPWVVLLGARAY